MKKSIFNLKNMMLVALLGISVSGVVHVSDNLTSLKFSKMLLQSTEALAGGDLGGGFYSNFRRAEQWYNSKISGGISVSEKPGFWVSGDWVSIMCCVNGTDMDACNFNIEDSECARRVERNSRN